MCTRLPNIEEKSRLSVRSAAIERRVETACRCTSKQSTGALIRGSPPCSLCGSTTHRRFHTDCRSCTGWFFFFCPQKRAAFCVQLVWPRVLPEKQLKHTPAHPQRRETISVSSLRKDLPDTRYQLPKRGKRYFCRWCRKCISARVFVSSKTASLDKHSRTHTGERPFACEVCEQRFTEKGALVRHKASKHEEGRPHCCHICNKTFKGSLCPDFGRLLVTFDFGSHESACVSAAREQLRVHVRRHKGMRKFQCSDCGYKFTRQVRIHF